MPNLVGSFEFVVCRVKRHFLSALKSTHNQLLTTYFKVKLGFTLIEILVAIGVIAVLVSVSTFALNNAREKGRDSKRKQDLAAIAGALALYFEQNGQYPANASEGVPDVSGSGSWISNLVPEYIEKLPVDPKQVSLNIFENLIGNVYAASDVKSPALGQAVSCSGTVSWSNPANIYTSDNVHASVSLANFAHSRCLNATQFGFAIPAGSTINGIQVRVEEDTSASNSILNDTNFKLLKAGVPVGTRKTSPPYFPTTEAYVTYGNSTDLWGTTWTVDEINNTGFGMSVQVSNDGGGPTLVATVDHITIEVFYTPPSPTPTPTPSPTPTPAPTPTPTPVPTPTPTPSPTPTPPPPEPPSEANNYMYSVVLDAAGKASSYILWAQLENTRDVQAYPNPSRDCTDTPPIGSTYNFCQKPD